MLFLTFVNSSSYDLVLSLTKEFFGTHCTDNQLVSTLDFSHQAIGLTTVKTV